MSSPIVAVFVSSTWLDLQPERSAVERAIQRLHETKFIGMEYFGSRDESTRRASLDEVDRSQVYVGILGGRFGSGITADEYYRARERGLPCFIYCKNLAAIPPMWCEQEAEPQAKLANWTAELRRHHIITEFSTPDELAAKVTADLHRWLFEQWLKPQLQQAVWQPALQPGIQQLLEQIKDKSELPADLLAQLRQRGYQVVSGQGNIAVGDDVDNSVLVSGSGNVINFYGNPPGPNSSPQAKPEPAAPKFEERARRIDAAVPSQVKVGAPVDLLLQVRFPDSKLLGLEEWPFKRKPASLEQSSESVELEFPVDAATGELGEARLYIRLVTPDFRIEGAAEKLLEVPPDEFSKIVKFLLVAKRAGYCRINVEIYDIGQVYLGSVPIEAEVGADLAVSAQPASYNVANFFFGVAVQGASDQASSKAGLAAVPPPSIFAASTPAAPTPDYSIPTNPEAPAYSPSAAPVPAYQPAVSPTGSLSPFALPQAAPLRKGSTWQMLPKIAALLFVCFGAFIVFRIASPMLLTSIPIEGDPTPRATGSAPPAGSPATETPQPLPSPAQTIRPILLPSPPPTAQPVSTPRVQPMVLRQLNGIRGRVVTAQGRPLAGVHVYVEGHPDWKAETDAEGRFFIRCGDTQTPLTLIAHKSKYQLGQARVSFEKGWPEQEIILKPSLELLRPLDPKRGIPRRPTLNPRPQP